MYVLCTYGDTGNSTSIFIPWITKGFGNGWRNFGGGGHNSEIQISGDSITNHTTGYTMRVYYR